MIWFGIVPFRNYQTSHLILGITMEATFKEIMELSDFPFDSQELSIVVGSDWNSRDLVFEKDNRIKDSINVFNFQGI